MKPIGCFKFARYLWTMITTASLLSSAISRRGNTCSDEICYISRHLPETEQKYITASNLWYRVLFACPNLSPSGCYVYMLYDPMLNHWPISKPDNLFQSRLRSFVMGHVVHVYQILVWPARPNFSAARSRKEKLGLDVLVECYRRIKQKHYTKVKSVMQKSPYFVFPVSVHGISIICTLS